MIDHIGFSVQDAAKSRAFYTQALAPIGYEVVAEYQGWVGIGPSGKPVFWFGPGEPKPPMHIAFQASERALVDAFYHTALEAGGRDNGEPGIRAHYHPNYYGAFVIDPDGNNVEVVCHNAE